MPVTTLTRRLMAAMSVLIAVGLAGCDSTPSGTEPPNTGGSAELTVATGPGAGSTPITSGRVASTEVTVHWDDQDRIVVTTWGSSSCPIWASDVELVSTTELALSLDTRADDDPAPTCTDDLVPLTSPIFPPDGLEVTSALTIHLRDGLTLILPPRP